MKRKIINICAQVFEVPVESIDGKTSPNNLEQWDSINHINLIMALEENLGILFPPEKVLDIDSVDSLINIIEEMKAGN